MAGERLTEFAPSDMLLSMKEGIPKSFKEICGLIADGHPFWNTFSLGGPKDCWIWFGAKAGRYGSTRWNKKAIYSHRLSYLLAVGPIPRGKYILHTCEDEPLCGNPFHLRAGTPKENIAGNPKRGLPPRKVNGRAPQMQCKRGHELQGQNLYITPNNKRQCRACDRIRHHPRSTR